MHECCREPDIPGDTSLTYEIELVKVEPAYNFATMAVAQRVELGYVSTCITNSRSFGPRLAHITVTTSRQHNMHGVSLSDNKKHKPLKICSFCVLRCMFGIVNSVAQWIHFQIGIYEQHMWLLSFPHFQKWEEGARKSAVCTEWTLGCN